MRNFIPRTVVFTLLLVALTVALTQLTCAQTFTVLHDFTGGQDGGNPFAGLTVAGPGNFYGTTQFGGSGSGVVYKLKGTALSPLYKFTGGNDGSNPESGIVIGPGGVLYGTTPSGGSSGLGTVFELKPPPTRCTAFICYWTESAIYPFSGPDGNQPGNGNLLFDAAGNIYGTTFAGGTYDGGVAYELTKSGNSWTETVLHIFGGGSDGSGPSGGLIFDPAGNLYGTTVNGGNGGCQDTCGTVYELMPSGGGWMDNILYDFAPREQNPYSTLVMDASGDLFGTNWGQVFELTPSNGGWTYSGLYDCPQNYAGVTMDSAGNLYGVCYDGGAFGYGLVFELAYSRFFIDLHDFNGSDGANPTGPVVLDGGNLYGTAYRGGNNSGCGSNGGCGTIWEISFN